MNLELENYQHPDQFGKWLGYRILSFDKTNHKTETELKIREDHLSPAGRVHGGVVSAFCDFSCGSAVFSTMGKQDLCSTIEIKVNYLRPINLGDVLIGKCHVVFRGKRSCVAQCLVYINGEEEPAAIAIATFNVVSR